MVRKKPSDRYKRFNLVLCLPILDPVNHGRYNLRGLHTVVLYPQDPSYILTITHLLPDLSCKRTGHHTVKSLGIMIPVMK